MNKSDAQLGIEIQKYLKTKGVETPMFRKEESSTEENDKINKISFLYQEIMKELGLDLSDDSLEDTPLRVAKMYVNELFYGLDYHKFPKCKLFKVKHDEMITVSNIKVMSVCEHHIQTISGFCHISYIPKEGCIGLSKLNRIVDFFSRRPQVQERLTEQIFYSLEYILKTSDIAVLIKADHFCVKARGIGDQNSVTTTTKIGGSFKTEESCRNEFYSMVKMNRFVCH